MHRRTRLTITIVAVFLVLLAGAVYLRKKAPPEAARLLPESDGIVYLSLRPMRAATHLDKHPVQHDPDYQRFIDQTGIQPERDLEEAAFALHRMRDPKGPNGPVAFSEVFVGHFNGRRLAQYLQSQAASTEAYAGRDIYSIPNEGRTVRVALLGYDMVAVSNTPSAEQIHSILDRHRSAALPFSGSSLLERHFHDVPLLSLAWGVGQIGLPFSESGNIHVFGFDLPLADDSTIIASAAPTLPVPGSLGSVRLRVEEIAASEDTAASQAAALATLVTLARGITLPFEASHGKEFLQQLLKTAEVSQHGERVIVTATLPASSLAGF